MNSREYDMISPDQVDHWMGNLKDLCSQTIIYPSPDQMFLQGSKLYIIDQLHEIACIVTHTDYPEVVLINNPQHPTWAHRPGDCL
jgi:hypothetical protein